MARKLLILASREPIPDRLLVVPAQRTVTYQDAHARSRHCAQSDLHSYVISDVLH